MYHLTHIGHTLPRELCDVVEEAAKDVFAAYGPISERIIFDYRGVVTHPFCNQYKISRFGSVYRILFVPERMTFKSPYSVVYIYTARALLEIVLKRQGTYETQLDLERAALKLAFTLRRESQNARYLQMLESPILNLP